MRGDAVGACGFAHRGRFNGTRLNSTACLPQCRNVVYVDVQPQMSCWHFSSPLGSHQLSWSPRVKRTLLALFLLTACSRAATTTTTTTSPVGAPAPTASTEPVNDQLTGAATPQAAIEKFLVAVKGQDIQAMAVIFGTS